MATVACSFDVGPIEVSTRMQLWQMLSTLDGIESVHLQVPDLREHQSKRLELQLATSSLQIQFMSR